MRVFFIRHIQGEPRQQSTLFPKSLDDYVSADNPVRVIDAFIDSLDMAALGFTQATAKATGRKPYHPANLLKLYTYGYLNQLRSTRRLEKECHRNVEVLWLMKRLAPDFKTIANFRQHNSDAIRQACRGFIRFCREARLLDSRLIAIDGSKFKAAASMSKTYNRKQLDALQKRLNRKVEGYLKLLAESERDENTDEQGSVRAALASLRQRQEKLAALSEEMDSAKATQCCETEPKARRMRSGREGVVVGYNVQTAVGADSGLIIICPAGQILSYQTYSSKDRQRLYARSGCDNCPQQARCTKANKRWISRHFHEEALDRSQARVEANPSRMSQRGAIVERPFAHLKQIMGIRRFQCWGKTGAKAEMGLA